MQRLAVIGLDAAEPLLVDRLIAQGELPTLARLKRSGARCRLHSEATWRAGRVWETLLTGTADNPSANFFDRQRYISWQIGSRKKTPFYADVPGLNVLAIDVPYMSLWYDVPGAQVIWGGHDAGYPRASRPAGLVREIDAKFGVHPAFKNDFTCAWWDEKSIDTLADALIVGSRRRCEIIAWLQKRFPDWNLFMTVLSETHSAGEIFWHGVAENHPLSHVATAPLARQRLIETYRELDRAVGQIIESLPKGTRVFVTSVHGMEANDYDIASMAILPELLYRAWSGKPRLRGVDGQSWRRQDCPPIVPTAREKWSDYMEQRFGPRTARRWLMGAARALGLIGGSQSPIHELSVPIKPETDATPDQINQPRTSLEWQVTSWYRRFWPQMRAFALPVFYDGRVRINLKGREKRGIVKLSDYTATCDWVEGLLSECRDLRTGRPVVNNIEHRNAADPLAADAADADLIVTWNPQIEGIEHPRLGTIGPFPYRRTGGHTDHGFACLTGPGIAAQDYGDQEALDLTATIRGLLGDPQARRSVFQRDISIVAA
jgi:predicted AlkP superfamily phosphohydrolase/phosphomutase